jgi:hypothetical protein
MRVIAGLGVRAEAGGCGGCSDGPGRRGVMSTAETCEIRLDACVNRDPNVSADCDLGNDP